jgi:UDP-glucose 4-epimerase
MKKKCLLTGATGLIGSHLIENQLEEYDVYALVRNSKNTNLSRNGSIQLIECDLSSKNFIDLLPKNMDIVIHLAQSPHYREFPEQAMDVFSVNSMACLKLLDYARRVGAKKFLLASSGTVYGEGQCKFFSEDEKIVIPNKSLGFYHTSKLCAELLAENYTQYMTIIILRFFFVFGPGQKKSMLIPRLVESVMNEKPIFLQGVDGISINPIYVSDAIRSIGQAMKLQESHKINVAGSEVLTLRGIGELIGGLLGKKPVFEIDSGASGHPVIGNIDKLKRLLAIPEISFLQGIENYIHSTYPEIPVPVQRHPLGLN